MNRKRPFSGEEVAEIQGRVTDFAKEVKIETLCDPGMAQYVSLLAEAKGSSSIYILGSLLGMAAAVLPSTVNVNIREDKSMPLSAYILLVGPPTSGKTSALRNCAIDPLTAVEKRHKDYFQFGGGSKQGLLKQVSMRNCHHCVIINDELSNFLTKVVKNCNMETEMMNSVWSGSPVMDRFKKASDTLVGQVNISMVGALPLETYMTLLTIANSTDGFLDRILVFCGTGLRLLSNGDEAWRKYSALTSPGNIYNTVQDAAMQIYRLHHEQRHTKYTLSPGSKDILKGMADASILAHNNAILQRQPLKNSKGPEHIVRVAVLMHILHQAVINDEAQAHARGGRLLGAGAGAPPPVNVGAGAPPPVNVGAGAPPPVNVGAGAPPPVNVGAGAPPPVNVGAGAPPPVNVGAGVQQHVGGRGGQQHEPNEIVIERDMLQFAIALVDFCEGVYDIIRSSVDSMQEPSKRLQKKEKSEDDIYKRLILVEGKCLVPKFIKSLKREFREEPLHMIRQKLQEYTDVGHVDGKDVFVKKPPEELTARVLRNYNCSMQDYYTAYNTPPSPSAGKWLRDRGYPV